MFDDIQDRGNGDRPVFIETNVGAAPKMPPPQSTAALVSGILGDLQNLVEQQFQLTRQEIEDEIRQRAHAAAIFALGAALLFLCATLLCLGIVHLLHWISLPHGSDRAGLPLWACHGVVAVVLAGVGGFLIHVGRGKFTSIKSFQNPLTELFQEHTHHE